MLVSGKNQVCIGAEAKIFVFRIWYEHLPLLFQQLRDMFSARGVKREGKDADVQSLTKIAKLHPTESCQSAGQEEMRQVGEDVENAHPECQTFFRAVEALLPQVVVRTSIKCERRGFPCPVWQKDPTELIGNRLPVRGGGRHMKAVGGAADLHSCRGEAHRLEKWSMQARQKGEGPTGHLTTAEAMMTDATRSQGMTSWTWWSWSWHVW